MWILVWVSMYFGGWVGFRRGACLVLRAGMRRDWGSGKKRKEKIIIIL